MAGYALAVDLGATHTRVALVDRQGHVSGKRDMPTRAEEGGHRTTERLADLLEEVASTVGRRRLVGVGVSLASPTDPETGVMYNPPNLPGWDGFTMKPLLEARLDLPVHLANDATLAALAEHRYGAGRGYRHLVYMTLSTGIGGGVVIGGRLYTGRKGFAGEVGHISIDRDGPPCKCGNVGCLEAMASGVAIARMARERLARGDATALRQMCGGDYARVDARMVAEAARRGDAVAGEIFREAAVNIGKGVVSVLHAFDPEVVVLGGGLTRSWDLLFPEVWREIQEHTMAHIRGSMPVALAELGDEVSLVGAAALAFARVTEARG